LSVDAFQPSVRPDCDTFDVAKPVGVDGGVVSLDGEGVVHAAVALVSVVADE
jgi:hypothetical protein